MIKHTRRQLLAHIGQIQYEVGLAMEYAVDDRNPDRAERLGKALLRAHDLCITACATDSPLTPREVHGGRTRVPGDGPKCQCGKPAVWSGYCDMEDGRGFCSNPNR